MWRSGVTPTVVSSDRTGLWGRKQWFVVANQGKPAAGKLLAGSRRAAPFATVPHLWKAPRGSGVQVAERADSGVLFVIAGEDGQRHDPRLEAFSALRAFMQRQCHIDVAVESIQRDLTVED